MVQKRSVMKKLRIMQEQMLDTQWIHQSVELILNKRKRRWKENERKD